MAANTTKEYEANVKKLNLPGACSAYWNLHRWYKIRNNIVHDAERTVDKKELSSFEWLTHKLIVATIEVVSKEKLTTLDELDRFLETEYRRRKAAW
ncbi:hypothetical protein KJ980_02930 [Patescibacteria group bacterium]|nr:hypothetical protein [Patescibacteria group bacterium]MBU4016107.1 hypothetical protein [Patescibacteria group bacterium]MBU4098580.1 hypothetical protein [Patescibacteria group bacterium]